MGTGHGVVLSEAQGRVFMVWFLVKHRGNFTFIFTNNDVLILKQSVAWGQLTTLAFRSRHADVDQSACT